MRRDFGPSMAGMRTFHFSDGDMAIETVADVTPILDANKRRQNDGTDGWSPTREWRHVACIPNIIVEKWRNEHGIDVLEAGHWPEVKKKLADPDWRYLRTGLGGL